MLIRIKYLNSIYLYSYVNPNQILKFYRLNFATNFLFYEIYELSRLEIFYLFNSVSIHLKKTKY